MSFERAGAIAPETGVYRYGRARQLYRGPEPDLDRPYITCIGGSETFGKFVSSPWPAELAARTGAQVVNFGTPSAGPGFYLKDPVLLETLSRSRLCIIQVMSAWSNSNRLFSVRKRRNERLQGTTEMFRMLYPDIEMEGYRYVQQLLDRLYTDDPRVFRVVEAELRASWIARMTELCEQVETRKVLFWFSGRAPEEGSGDNASPIREMSPAFVDREMIERIRPMVDAVVEHVAPEGEDGLSKRFEGGPNAHLRVQPSAGMHVAGAGALEPVVRDLLGLDPP